MPLRDQLSVWLTEGTLQDAYGEFFIAADEVRGCTQQIHVSPGLRLARALG